MGRIDILRLHARQAPVPVHNQISRLVALAFLDRQEIVPAVRPLIHRASSMLVGNVPISPCLFHVFPPKCFHLVANPIPKVLSPSFTPFPPIYTFSHHVVILIITISACQILLFRTILGLGPGLDLLNAQSNTIYCPRLGTFDPSHNRIHYNHT